MCAVGRTEGLSTNVPKVTWTSTVVDHEFLGFTPVTAKELIGEVDNASYPAFTVKMHADGGAAGGEMEDLPHGGVVEVV